MLLTDKTWNQETRVKNLLHQPKNVSTSACFFLSLMWCCTANVSACMLMCVFLILDGCGASLAFEMWLHNMKSIYRTKKTSWSQGTCPPVKSTLDKAKHLTELDFHNLLNWTWFHTEATWTGDQLSCIFLVERKGTFGHMADTVKQNRPDR